MWSGRKAAFPAVGRLAPDYYCMDGTIPRRHLASVLARIAELSQRHGLPVANVFHAGDGNLHPLIMFDAGNRGTARSAAERFGAEILELCVDDGRHGHRRARCRRREAGSDVQPVRGRGARDVSRDQARVRSRRCCSTPARPCRRSRAAPTTVRCACTAAGCRMHTCRGSDPHERARRDAGAHRGDPRWRRKGSGRSGSSAATRRRGMAAPSHGERLSTREHCGILHYDPARARDDGSLRVRRSARSRQRSMPADNGCRSNRRVTRRTPRSVAPSPPALRVPRARLTDRCATTCSACGSLNGAGQVLRFGGEVMKNVAGYDVSRLMAGSLGVLGVLLDVSLKVLPRPAESRTLGFDCSASEALERLQGWCAASPAPAASCLAQRSALRPLTRVPPPP